MKPKPTIECIKITEDEVLMAIGEINKAKEVSNDIKVTKEAIAKHIGCEVKDILEHLFRLQKTNWIINDFKHGGYRIA